MGFDLHHAMEWMDSFAHSAYAHASALRLNRGEAFRRNSLSLVANLKTYLATLGPNGDFGGLTAGMAVDVREAFLHQAEHHQFHLAAESSQIVGNVDRDLHAAAFLQTLRVPAQGNRQAALVEQRRMKQVRHDADFLAELLHIL